MNNISSRLKIFSFSLPTVLAVGVVALVAMFTVGVHPTYAAAGDFSVTVNQELGSGLAGASVHAVCTGGSAYITLTDAGAGVYTATHAAMNSAQADCTDGENVILYVTKDGYISKTDSSHVYTEASDPDEYTVSNVLFSVKVHVTREGDGADLNNANSVNAGISPVLCTFGAAGLYYCPVVQGDDDGITVAKSGYVTNTSGSTGTVSTSSQSVTSVTNVRFQVRIDVADQFGTGTNADTVKFNGNDPTVTDGSSYFFAQTGSNKTIVINKIGFIYRTHTGVSASSQGQTHIALSNYSSCSSSGTWGLSDTTSCYGGAPISGGTNGYTETTIMGGLEYKFVSNMLKSENGGAITNIASEPLTATGDMGASVTAGDVTITNNGGSAGIAAVAVVNDVIYVAAVGAGAEASDAMIVTLSNVTADGGAANAASFVKANISSVGTDMSQTTSAKTFGIGSGASADLSNMLGFKYPLKVVLGDELGMSGNDINAVNLSAKHYNEIESNYYTGNTLYYGNLSTHGSLILHAPGFVPEELTNNSLLNDGEGGRGVTTTQDSQVVITLDTSSVANGTTITSNTSLKGFQYVLKSEVLKTEIGGDISDLADFACSCGNTPDVNAYGTNGAAVVALAVNGNSVYIAATGDGGDNDTVTVKVQNVTTDGGVANSATLVKASMVDTGNVINTGTSVNAFQIGGGAGALHTTGFRYPLFVTVKDELGNAYDISSLNAFSYGSSEAPYAAVGNNAVFANIAPGAALVISKNGFVPSGITNSGLSNVVTSQNAQTKIVLGTDGAVTSIVTATENKVRGLTYSMKSNSLQTQIGGSISSMADGFNTACGDTCAPSADVNVSAIGGAGGIVAAAVKDDYIYLAATADNLDWDEIFGIQVQNVNADGAIGDTGDFVHSSFILNSAGSDINISLSDGPIGQQYRFNLDSATHAGEAVGAAFMYPLEVTLKDELGNDLDINPLLDSGSCVDVNNCITYNGATPYYFVSNAAFFANTASNALLSIKKDGYVNAQTTNTGMTDVSANQNNYTLLMLGTDDPRTLAVAAGDDSDTGKGLLFGQKVNITTEAGQSMDLDSVTAGSSNTSCYVPTESSTAYCPVPVSQDNGEGDVTIVKNGFVTNTSGSTNNRINGTSAQNVISVSDVKYGLKVAVQEEGTGNPVTGSALVIKTVDGMGTYGFSCPELGSGMYGCIVPTRVDDGTNNIRITHTNYAIKYLPFTDRPTNATAQRSITALLGINVDRDVTAPTVSAQYPLSAATDVATSANPYVTFDEALDPTSVTGENIVLCQTNGEGSCSPIEATITLGNGGTRVTFIPDTSLNENALYMIRVTTGIKDLAGNYFSAMGWWNLDTFTTGATSLQVTQVSTVANTNGAVGAAVANDTYEDGFAWVFKVTLPENEQDFRMKFSDFINGSHSIDATNIRYCSAQDSGTYNCSDSEHYHSIGAADSYTGSWFYATTDLSPTVAGRQVEVRVEMKVPTGTAAGSYSGSYGVQSTAD